MKSNKKPERVKDSWLAKISTLLLLLAVLMTIRTWGNETALMTWVLVGIATIAYVIKHVVRIPYIEVEDLIATRLMTSVQSSHVTQGGSGVLEFENHSPVQTHPVLDLNSKQFRMISAASNIHMLAAILAFLVSVT